MYLIFSKPMCVALGYIAPSYYNISFLLLLEIVEAFWVLDPFQFY